MDGVTELMLDWKYEVTSYHVFDLVNQSSCTAYDCEFVALAQELGVSWVTTDRQMQEQFPDTALSPDAFLSSGSN
jgi:predicted nucleic acid-binding protein